MQPDRGAPGPARVQRAPHALRVDGLRAASNLCKQTGLPLPARPLSPPRGRQATWHAPEEASHSTEDPPPRRASLGRSAFDVAAGASQPPSAAMPGGPPPRPLMPGPLSSLPPRPRLRPPARSPHRRRRSGGCTLAGCDRVPWPGSRARAPRGSSGERSCCVVGPLPPPPPSARRLDWRAAERAAERASAVPTRSTGGSRPGRREGRWLGEAGRREEPIRAP